MSKKMYEQFACSRMMLAEQREELTRRIKKLQQEEHCSYPIFDEQQWEEFENLFNQSIECGAKITVTVREGKNDFLSITGVAQKKFSPSGRVQIRAGEEVKMLFARDIIKIERS